jgi:hypothetical protein
MKVFRLHPADDQGWLVPATVVERLRGAFDHVVADEEEGLGYAAIYVSTYRSMRAAGVGPPDATPVELVERQWRDATVIRAGDDAAGTAPFEVLVRREYRLELRFATGTHFRRKQRTAAKVASALGYVIDCLDPKT